MRKLSKISVALIAVIASVFGLSATAFAAEPETKTDYGLEAVISSDKEEYKANEDINLSLKVTNTNDFAVENVSLEALIPDGLTVKDKSNLLKSVDSLKSGESIELSVVAVKEGTESSNESSTESSNTSKTDDNKKTVSTGSASNIAILIILVAGAGFAIVLAVKFKKKATKFIAVILCTAIGFSSVVIFNYPVTAKETDVSSFTVSKVVAVDGDQITISGKVGYSTNSKSPEDNKKPEYDKEHIIKYSNNDYIYKPTEESIAYDSEKFVTYYDNLIIAYTYDDLSSDKADSLADSINGVVVGDISGSVNALQILVSSTDISTLTSYSNKLMKSDEVMFATYDAPMEISDSATDSNPWSIDGKTSKDRGNEKNPSGNDWWAEAIGAYTAWEYSDYANPIKVGVLDNGFKLDHEDLSNIKMLEPNFTQNSPDDHGTHVAGIISAQNNNVGIRGVADKAELICADWSPITNNESDPQYVNQLNTGEYIEITKQMIEKGVKVINNSWGASLQSKLTYKTSSWYNLFKGDYKSYCKQYENGIKQEAANCIVMIGSLIKNGYKDFIIVQSAGNGYDNTGTHGVNAKYSSCYTAINKNLFDTISSNLLFDTTSDKLEEIKFEDIDQRILIVGGVENSRDKSGNYYMTKGSNYGENVDICAPGEDILSTVLDYNKNRTTRRYKEKSGTSMAAPMVTGAAALVWSINPNYSAGDVKDLLIKSSTYKAIGVGDDKGNSYPMLNVGAAVKTAYEQVKKPYDVTISGTVTDESNTPLSDAKVSLYNNENTLVGSTLTEDGKFSFKLSQKESQNYTLEFEKSGYTAKSEKLLDVKENQTVNVILEKNNGKVIDSGKTGNDSVIWTVYEDGTLEFSGNGEIGVYYRNLDVPPWYNKCTKLVIGDGITKIPEPTLWSLPKSNVAVNRNNKNYLVEDGVLFDINKTQLIIYSRDKKDTTYKIPDGVKNIENNSFLHCNNLKEVIFPDSVENIGWWAFCGCTSLQNINLPNSLKGIEDGAFISCTSLQNINLPNGIELIGNNAFSGCTSLTSVYIPGSIKTLSFGVFHDCTSLKNITIQNGVEELDGAFYNCTSLKSINIPDSVKDIIGEFYGCTSIQSINVSSGNKNYTSVDGILFNKDKTELVLYPAGKTTKSYNIPNSVISVGNNAFEHCNSLTSITIPNSVTSIGFDAFSYCTDLKSITIPKSVSTMAKRGSGNVYTEGFAFRGWQSSQTIYIEGRNYAPSGWSSMWKDGCNAKIVWNA